MAMRPAFALRTRIVLTAVLPTGLLALVLTLLFAIFQLDELARLGTERGRALARELALAAEYPLFAGDRAALTQLTESLAWQTDVLGVAIVDREGRTLVRQGALDEATVAGPAFERFEGGLRLREPVRSQRLALDDALVDHALLMPASSVLGHVVLELAQPGSGGAIGRLLWRASLALLVCLGVGWAMAQVLGRRLDGALRQLADNAARIGKGEFAGLPRLAAAGGELARLDAGLDEAAMRLARTQIALRQQIDEASAELRASKEEAERASLAKSRFLAAASHDLRQPMHALGLFIAELAHQPHPPATRKLVAQIAASAEAIENLLDGLLDISRLDAGILQPVFRAVPLQHNLDLLEQQFGRAAANRGLSLIVRPSLHWAYTDPVLLGRVVGNLVSNAIRYTPAGRILVAVRKAGNGWRLEVRDSGVGIEDDAQDVIFHEFVQLDVPAHLRNQGQGLGLGLAIVRRLCDLLGHRVGLRSHPGAGSVFSVWMTAAEPPPALPDPEGGSEADEAAAEVDAGVLLIGNDRLALDSLDHLLQTWGLAVVRAPSVAAAQALAGAETAAIRLIVYDRDHALPPFEALQSLRARLTADSPLVVLGTGDEGHENNALQVILKKPVRPARLRALILRLIDAD